MKPKIEMPKNEGPQHEAFTSAWAIRPQSFDRFCKSISSNIKAFMSDDDQDDELPKYTIENGVAVVPLSGVMMRRPGWLVYWGACDTDHFSRMMAKAADDEMCKAIVIDIDSPGGSVIGTPEAAASVMAAREKKPVVAYSGGLMCSAAYWVASQSNAVYASRSAIVGSIGCYSPVYDYSGYYAAEGITVNVIRSGKYKGGNVSGAKVGEEYIANLQRVVDGIGASFRADVKAIRPMIQDDVMEGQEFLGSDCIGAGLVDSVAGYDRAVADASALAAMR
jgi:signal peptide peptidase SppA